MSAASVLGCPDCPPAREARDLFVQNLGFDVVRAALPFVLIAIVVFAVARVVRRYDGDASVSSTVSAGLVLGIGLGGFLDGIVLHQILQWHEMMSSVVPPDGLVEVKYNMIWDGLFHAGVWLTTVLGVLLLVRAARRGRVRSKRIFGGSLLGGWGLFNFIEGLVDHQLLGLHHVHPGSGQAAWDWGFVLVGGLGFMALGFVTTRSDLAGHSAV
ncbi:MAG TPA: DUF2243 domain-containing protein [Kofleriaceae bacterium]|nr:DUF2243 domain-containing protein [Kofleriaceae bacterium]